MVIKRDGRIVAFEKERILNAIREAVQTVPNCTVDVQDIANSVIAKIMEVRTEKAHEENKAYEDVLVSVEDIQNIVENTLIAKNLAEVAKSYILYRAKRNELRERGSELIQIIKEVTETDAAESDMKRENANIDADSPMGAMLKYGAETSKYFLLHHDLPPEMAQHHITGDYHIHDLDFEKLTTTCCQISLGKKLREGFSTGHGYVRQPQSIGSAAALACILIQANQNDQHGGQSIWDFDYGLAPYVEKTYVRNIMDVIITRWDLIDSKITALNCLQKQLCANIFTKAYMGYLDKKELYKAIRSIWDDLDEQKWEIITTKALQKTQVATEQAMEAVIHNLNTMHSRCGGQVPFSSVNFGTDTSIAGRLVIKSFLKALDNGLGMGETSIFPVAIFKVKDGVNYNKTDINYDLFHYACAVSARRLFPNFAFIDAPFNLQYYKENKPETEIAYMGCVAGEEVITYMLNGKLYVEGIMRAYARISVLAPTQTYGISQYIDTTDLDLQIYDSYNSKFVKVKKFICNPDKHNWKRIVFAGGRTVVATEDHPLPVITRGRIKVSDLRISDKVYLTQNYNTITNAPNLNVVQKPEEYAWLLGVLLCAAKITKRNTVTVYSPTNVVAERIKNAIQTYMPVGEITITKNTKKHSTTEYYNVEYAVEDFTTLYRELMNIFGAKAKKHRQIPVEVFSYAENQQAAFIAGMLEVSGRSVTKYLSKEDNTQIQTVKCICNNVEVSEQLVYLLQLIGITGEYTRTVKHRQPSGSTETVYVCTVLFNLTECVQNALTSCDIETVLPQIISATAMKQIIAAKQEKQRTYCTIVSITDEQVNDVSYDVETESDRFDVGGIQSHNCRTRVIGNVHDTERQIVAGRGNLSFTSINLPRIGIKTKLYVEETKCTEEEKWRYFYTQLDSMLKAVIEQLDYRFEVQAKRHVYNYPVLMQQGIWIDSEKLCMQDEVREVLKHGTLSVGFIGLAECLVAVMGQHHGASAVAQTKGLEIITYMRKYLDALSQERQLNYTLLATPAEGLCGTFLRKDRRIYGVIPGVTDKEYYTNSNHIPVNYKITASRKIKLEAPYHALTNAGHICYVELDGDTAKNVAAFERIVRYMKEQGIGYGAINHPVDRDPVCGYVGIINDVCPRCGRREGEKMSQEMWERLQSGKMLNAYYDTSVIENT